MTSHLLVFDGELSQATRLRPATAVSWLTEQRGMLGNWSLAEPFNRHLWALYRAVNVRLVMLSLFSLSLFSPELALRCDLIRCGWESIGSVAECSMPAWIIASFFSLYRWGLFSPNPPHTGINILQSHFYPFFHKTSDCAYLEKPTN